MDRKSFIITIDTEEDNQWDPNSRNTTRNASYLRRFQNLCETYGFVPVYLTTYGMARDKEFAAYMKPRLQAGACEIGMHLHAWNSPPEYALKATTDNKSYLIEYPDEVMRAKLEAITELLENTFEHRITAHRAGRWATNDIYFRQLTDLGFLVDCSVTPHVSWAASPGAAGLPGTDYRFHSEKPYFINETLLEVPVTVRKGRVFEKNRVYSVRSFLGELRKILFKKSLWLRPDGFLAEHELLKIIDINRREDSDYLMFVLHSSELMPGGSPNFRDEESIEGLYRLLEKLFQSLSGSYLGRSLTDYYMMTKEKLLEK